MKIAVDDIKASPQDLSYTEDVEALNARLGGGVQDYRVPVGPGVDVQYYRAGLDLFFQGAVHGDVLGSCSRCLVDYRSGLEQPVMSVLPPAAAARTDGEALSADD